MSSDGVLSNESGSVVVKPCTSREVAFYESALAHPDFAAWMPTFFGTLSLSDESTAIADRKSSLVLQNLTYGFVKPCVLDIKLGAQLWDDFAPQEKRDRLDLVSDATTSRSLGLRIAGMRVWKKEGEYRAFDKQYGRVFTAETVGQALHDYFDSDVTPEQVRLVAKRFLDKVKQAREVLEGQESRMYSASLLFVYEGDGKALEEALEEEKTRKPKNYEDDDEDDDEEDEKIKMVEELKLIDFAHADWTPGLGPDENVLQGVRSTENLLAEIIA